FSSTLIAIALGIIISYFFAFNALRDSLGKEYVQMSQMLASFVKEAFNDEVENAMTYANSILWVEGAQGSNAKYGELDSEGVNKLLADMDKRWAKSDADSSLAKEYTDNKLAVSMKDVLKIRTSISEILIADKFGGLVAASGRPDRFSQADTEWWKEAFADGKGRIYAGDIETNEATQALVIPLAIPMRNKSGAVVGILKETISIDRLFGRLKEFRIGETGHAVLLDRDGYILFHHRISPMRAKYRSQGFDNLLQSKKLYNLIVNPYTHKAKMFMAFTKIELPLFKDRGIYWRLFIDQDAEEAFAPLNTFVINIAIVMLAIIVIMIPIGYILSGVYANPINKLRTATEKIVQGDWDYDIKIHTNDEIEEFADSFGAMVSNLKAKQKELLQAKEETEGMAHSLERKVEARTKDLRAAQRKTLTILEDLMDAKNRLESKTGELEKALKIKSDFISTVSHELRTPLAAIKESISIVLDGVTGDTTEPQKEFLNMAKRNVDRLARLINDILDFQKMESGKTVFNIQKNDINETVEEVGNTMATIASQKNLEFTLELEENLPRFNFDKDKIIQVLTNLVSNAIKFTDKGGITIKTASKGSAVYVSVQDTGLGIKEEDIPKLFMEFEQLDRGIERQTGGTGLGLAISKKIIERHDGRIWAASERDKGSTFTFFLPFN
ncbi:MAG: ATP-binding protein, partial [Candidatus Omnitrophica bacterium]|nr:ATP-binding protein [Candidatus Omnitrophota bacterium]